MTAREATEEYENKMSKAFKNKNKRKTQRFDVAMTIKLSEFYLNEI